MDNDEVFELDDDEYMNDTESDNNNNNNKNNDDFDRIRSEKLMTKELEELVKKADKAEFMEAQKEDNNANAIQVEGHHYGHGQQQQAASQLVAPRPAQFLTPPENFSMVCGAIYRSSFPKEENFEFLSKLNLKSVICLISEEYPEDNRNFLLANNIQFFQIGLSGNKEPFVKIKANLIEDALKIVLDPANQPILIHCNRGKHRTGCLIGCIRKLQKWSLSMIFDEYRKFSYPKTRPLDQQFIEMFDDDGVHDYLESKAWLPVKW